MEAALLSGSLRCTLSGRMNGILSQWALLTASYYQRSDAAGLVHSEES